MPLPSIQRFGYGLAVLGTAFVLSACDRQADETVGQSIDRTVEATDRNAERAGAAVREATRDATNAAQDAAQQSRNALDDAAITATVKTELVRDPGLSALNINVDTAKGEVTLRGEADSLQARERAERIARSVQGVTKVNNELTLKQKG